MGTHRRNNFVSMKVQHPDSYNVVSVAHVCLDIYALKNIHTDRGLDKVTLKITKLPYLFGYKTAFSLL